MSDRIICILVVKLASMTPGLHLTKGPGMSVFSIRRVAADEGAASPNRCTAMLRVRHPQLAGIEARKTPKNSGQGGGVLRCISTDITGQRRTLAGLVLPSHRQPVVHGPAAGSRR